MVNRRYKLTILLGGGEILKREFIAHSHSSSSDGYYYFAYPDDKHRTMSYYPISNTIIDKIESESTDNMEFVSSEIRPLNS